MNSFVERIEVFAREAHKGQVRKFEGGAFIEHPRRVAERMETDAGKALAWLHDVLEDTHYELPDIADKLEIPLDIRWSLLVITKKKGEDYLEYILRVAVDDLARNVKLADLEDNMSDLKEGTLKDKYKLAYYMLKHWKKDVE